MELIMRYFIAICLVILLSATVYGGVFKLLDRENVKGEWFETVCIDRYKFVQLNSSLVQFYVNVDGVAAPSKCY